MAKNDNLQDFMVDVADAIRAKEGSSDLINPQDFSTRIANLSGGGSVDDGNTVYINTSTLSPDDISIGALEMFCTAVKVAINWDDEAIIDFLGPRDVVYNIIDFEVGWDNVTLSAFAIDVKSPIHLLVDGIEITNREDALGLMGVDISSLPKISKEEFYSIKTLPYKIGTFIQHIDGSLYSEREWVTKGFSNEEANGIYVSNGAHSFIVAKDFLAAMPWSLKSSTLIDEVPVTNMIDVENYMNGAEDSSKIAAFDANSAAAACANYTFPNGQKGYLGSTGEMLLCYISETEIGHLMELIGGTQLGEKWVWTSVQYDATKAMTVRLGGIYDYYQELKSGNWLCRPLCVYIENKQ